MFTIQGFGYFKYCRILERNIADIERAVEYHKSNEDPWDWEEIEVNIKHFGVYSASFTEQELGGVPVVDWLSGACDRNRNGVYNSDCKQCRAVLADEGGLWRRNHAAKR